MQDPPCAHVAFFGHERSGKSTLYGAILRSVGVWDDRAFAKHRKSLCCGETRLHELSLTGAARLTLLDVPGGRIHLSHAVNAAAQTDMALFVVSAKAGELDGALKGGGARSSLLEHIRIAGGLGTTRAVVAVAKLGEVGWAQECFEAARKTMTELLVAAGFSHELIAFSLVDGISGEVRSESASWHVEGTLLEQLEDMVLEAALETSTQIRTWEASSCLLFRSASAASPVLFASKLRVSLVVLEAPRAITVGFRGILHVHASTVGCEIIEIQDAFDLDRSSQRLSRSARG